MSISANKFKNEQLGDSKFSHSLSEPRPLSEESFQYLCDRGFLPEVINRCGVSEMRVNRFERQGWRRVPNFYGEPAVCFPLNNKSWHVCMFRIDKKERWLTTPAGCGVGFFGDLDSKDIILTEGEFDCMCLLSHGIPAVSNSCGAGTFNAQMAVYFLGKKVWICYDRDPIGKRGAMNASKFIARTASEVRIVDLPLPGTSRLKDVSDFFKKGGTCDEFRKLCDTAIRYKR